MGSLCFCYTTQAALNTSLGSMVVSSLSNWNRAYNRSNKPHVNIFKETDNVILPVPPALQFLKSTELIQGHTGKECLLVVPEDGLEHRLKLTQIYWILLFVAAISLERDICGDEGGKNRFISFRASGTATAPPSCSATFQTVFNSTDWPLIPSYS